MRFTVLLAEMTSECIVGSGKYADSCYMWLSPLMALPECIYLVWSKHKTSFAADFVSYINNGPTATHALLCDVLSWVSVFSTAVITPHNNYDKEPQLAKAFPTSMEESGLANLPATFAPAVALSLYVIPWSHACLHRQRRMHAAKSCVWLIPGQTTH